MRNLIAVLMLAVACMTSHASTAEDTLTATLIPAEIRPGDLFRLEVNRSSEDYAEFLMDVPIVESLHLIAKEHSPVEWVNGRYIQSETWIFQADASGEVLIEDVKFILRNEQGETTATLPPLELSVLPYSSTDPDASPLRWEAPESGSSGVLIKVFLLLIVLLGATVSVKYLSQRKSKSVVPETAEPDLFQQALKDLDSGMIKAKSLHTLYEKGEAALSPALRTAIEQTIYANRGDPAELAKAIRKETQP